MKKILLYGVLFTFLLVFNGYANALCVNVSEANLRKGPGTNYKITWQVTKYTPLKKISKKGNWYKVKDVDGDEHWIYRKLVTDKFRCAAVKVDEANIRTGPGLEFEKTSISPAVKYESFKVEKIKGSWVRVKDEFGFTGWMFRKLLWIY